VTTRLLEGDCRVLLPTLDANSIQCCVTSPPYYGLRDYGVDGQIGLEQTPDEYVAQLVEVFRGVRRLLREDGTLWLNLGDSYAMNLKANANRSGADTRGGLAKAAERADGVPRSQANRTDNSGAAFGNMVARTVPTGLKSKDLLGIPWRVAFALQADGWWLRSAIVWHKPNPMPESVKDRPTSAYEMVFLLAKQPGYFYDADAIREEITSDRAPSRKAKKNGAGHLALRPVTEGAAYDGTGSHRNARNVWTITPKPYKGAHFATMPIDLAARCILAGSRIGDTVLDPFGGSGTTGLAADIHQRHSVLIELNTAQYTDLARDRITSDAPLFASVI
jgi:DNA modification methylase